MNTWFYAINEQQHGPVSTEAIRSLIQAGTLDRHNDLVWKDGMADWTPPEKIADFLTAATASPTAAPVASPGLGPKAAQNAGDLNPYAAPATDPSASTLAPGTHLRSVKPANFLLMTLCLIGGFIMMGFGFFSSEEFTGEPSTLGIAVILLSLVPLLLGTVLACIYLYRAWWIIADHTRLATPGRAVGFLFIPFYNLYWFFVAYWRWSEEWNRIVASDVAHRNPPRMTEGLFLTYAILNAAGIIAGALAALPQIIIFFIIMKRMCDAINWAATTIRA